MFDGATLASFLTPNGIVAAGALLTAFVSVVKTYLAFTAKWDGMQMLFIAAVALYVAVGVATSANSLEAGFTVFTSWLACLGTGVLGHKAVVKPVAARLLSKAVVKPAVVKPAAARK